MAEIIAETNFGRVEKFRFKDGKDYACKYFAPKPGQFPPEDLLKLRQRFAREVKVQRELDNTMFMPIVNANLDVDPPWFVMPLADKTLLDHLQVMRSDNNALLSALGQILDALTHLHSLGYVHRDLKPQNILLHAGRWKLSDFGLVLPAASGSTKLSSSQSAWGTREYCAPEQTIEFGKVTSAADVYAFGCILHDIFDGRQRVPHQRQSCDGPVGAIIERCTEAKAERRFRTLHGLREALFGVLAMQPRPIMNTPSAGQAQQIAARIPTMETMTDGDILELVRFLNALTDLGEGHDVFNAMNDDRIGVLYQRNAEAWQEFALKYCEWAGNGIFSFHYCDVIVERLAKIFALGALEVKAASILAAASLARSHNRYYVMDRVLTLCGHSMEDNVAHRISIEILASDVHADFRACATVIDRELTEYHPRIAKVVPPIPPPPSPPSVVSLI